MQSSDQNSEKTVSYPSQESSNTAAYEHNGKKTHFTLEKKSCQETVF